MTLIFCSECGYRTYTTSQAISQEFCDNCGRQGTMKEVKLALSSAFQEVNNGL